MLKRGITLLFSMVIIISIFPVTVFATEFSDIPNNWSREVLKNAVSNGLLYGKNEQIRPDDDLTRSELATIVNRAFNADEEALINQFSDVPEGAWYYDEMAKAVQMGTLKGYGNMLNPENSITREEAFVVLARAFNLSNENHSTLNSFIDRDQVSLWAKDSVTSLVAEGYIAGANGKLNPKNKITRAEFAQVMDNLVKVYIKQAGTYTMVNKGNVMINVPNVTLKDITINGDLIIGDGVGDGDVFIENVIVTGRTVVRGGGENSIKIIGNSNLQNIIVARVNGVVRIYGEEGSNLGQLTVNGRDDVILEGRFKNVKLATSGVVLIAKKATIENVEISASNTGVIVSKESNIEALTLNAVESNVEVLGAVKKINATEKAVEASISVAEGGQVEEVLGKAKGTKINGKGSVKRVEAKADNVEVNTANTKVQVDKDVKGVKANGKDLARNTSTEDKVDTIDKKDRKEKKGGKSSGGHRDDDNDTTESDLTAYTKLLTSVKEVNYTVESWKVYKEVVEDNGVTSESMQSEVEVAVKAIKSAQAQLVKIKADLKAYNKLLASVKEANYTAESWKAYKEVVEDNGLTSASMQLEVEVAVKAIKSAQAQLAKVKADLKAYNKLLDSVKEVNYTVESWKAYKKIVEDNGLTSESMQSEVEVAVKAIELAQAQLVKIKADLKSYNKLLASVKEANYTAESWKAYKEVVEDNAITLASSQSEVDLAAAVIKRAQSALVKKEQAPLVATIEITMEQVLPGYDKVKISLNVENPEDYIVGTSTMLAFIYNQDGTFTGVVKAGTTAKEIQVSKKEGKIEAEIVKMLEFLPGVYDVHVKLAVNSPENYTVSYEEKAFKLEDGVFKGSSYTKSITVENLVILKNIR